MLTINKLNNILSSKFLNRIHMSFTKKNQYICTNVFIQVFIQNKNGETVQSKKLKLIVMMGQFYHYNVI